MKPIHAIAALGCAGALALTTTVVLAMPPVLPAGAHPATHAATHPRVAPGTKLAPAPKAEPRRVSQSDTKPADTTASSTKAKVKPATAEKRLSAPLPVRPPSPRVSAPAPAPSPQKPAQSPPSSSPAPEPAGPTWTAADQAAADAACVAMFGPDSRPLNAPAIGAPKNPDVHHYACTMPGSPRPPGTQPPPRPAQPGP